MKTVFVRTPCSEKNRIHLQEACGKEYTFLFGQDYDRERDLEEMKRCQIIVGEPDYEDIRNLPQLEWVQMTWAGTDKYTKNGPFPDNVLLTNASGAFGVIISEYIIAGILSLYRRLPYYHERQKEHNWCPLHHEETLFQKNVLILGAGNIGSETAKRLKAFDCQVYGIRRNPVKMPYFDQIATVDCLDEWLGQADVVICCMPNNPDSMNLLTYDRLCRMKDSAIIVNVGRGHIFAENALEEVLIEGKIAGAVLDVQRTEPLNGSHPFWEMDQVILTPHIAGPSFSSTEDTQDRIYEIVAENLQRYAKGEDLRNLTLTNEKK
ncbi:MAG: D-2-hydroxyacid dehydrogenase [Eubacteriales bacterium]|nr:D-2-hydroxyacid dehydrogenase [Eubacteriales bacterium]